MIPVPSNSRIPQCYAWNASLASGHVSNVSNIFVPLLNNSNVLCLKDPQSIQFLTACLKALILEIQIIQFHPISLQITQFPKKVPQIFSNHPLFSIQILRFFSSRPHCRHGTSRISPSALANFSSSRASRWARVTCRYGMEIL